MTKFIVTQTANSKIACFFLILNTFLFSMSYSELQYDIIRISAIFIKKKMDPFTNIAWLCRAEKNKVNYLLVIKTEGGG